MHRDALHVLSRTWASYYAAGLSIKHHCPDFSSSRCRHTFSCQIKQLGPRDTHDFGPVSFYVEREDHHFYLSFLPLLFFFLFYPRSDNLSLKYSVRRRWNEAKTFHLHALFQGVEKPVNLIVVSLFFLSFSPLLQGTRITLARYRYHRFIPILSPSFGGECAEDKLITGRNYWPLDSNLIAGEARTSITFLNGSDLYSWNRWWWLKRGFEGRWLGRDELFIIVVVSSLNTVLLLFPRFEKEENAFISL